MMREQVSISVPGILKYSHFVSDTGELLFRERINFYADDLLQHFLQDMQIIMYELFANAFYHSKSDSITVEFELEDEWVNVTIKTNNIGFGVKPFDSDTALYPPYPKAIIDTGVVVYKDHQNQVICNVEGPFRVSFENKRHPMQRINVEDLPEHYGMNLITKFSHQSFYYRDETGTDCFVVKRKIR
ncbi:MAG: hypothetical protein HY965_01250 [Ignavibacteriales bacterium]|nr:hypothetical protein [Ignavibacteriales bacterium]